MSITPIFDATLADAPVNIWQASDIFPRPIGHISAETSCAAVSSWYFMPSLSDPTNLSFLRNVA
jgi:hypothetical protein